MTRLIWWFIRIFILVIILYALFFGNLLFINPIKLGVRQRQSEQATIYTRNIYKLSPFYNFVDQYMAEAEEFYGMKFQGNVDIYVAETKSEFKRYMLPWELNGANVDAKTLETGTVIYFNLQQIVEDNISQEEIIKHELMKALMYQNASILNAIVITNQDWYIEGAASYFGGPHYMNKNEFASAVKDKDLQFEERSYKLFVNLDPKEKEFNSSVYKYFTQFIIEKYGQNKYRQFMTRYLQSPGNFKIIFFEIYNKRFKLVVDEFVDEYQ